MTTEAQPEPAEGTSGPGGDFQPVPQELPVHTDVSGKSNEEVANEILAGLWGRGNARKERLTAAGYNPDEVSNEVNKILGGSRAKARADRVTETVDDPGEVS